MTEVKIINGYPFMCYKMENVSAEQSLQNSRVFLDNMEKRRSIRYFRNKPVQREVIRNILSVANTAPSGANKQPWTFFSVHNAAIKKQIREAAKKEEYESYHG
jgi:iodotyrosine deiodinase